MPVTVRMWVHSESLSLLFSNLAATRNSRCSRVLQIVVTLLIRFLNSWVPASGSGPPPRKK